MSSPAVWLGALHSYAHARAKAAEVAGDRDLWMHWLHVAASVSDTKGGFEIGWQKEKNGKGGSNAPSR